MVTYSWLVIGLILLVFLLVMLIESRLEASQRYWECYLQRSYKGKADNYKCYGVAESNRCKDCPYYKKYWKEN